MSILITVSKGFLGTHLAHLLHESGSTMFNQEFVKDCEPWQNKNRKTALTRSAK